MNGCLGEVGAKEMGHEADKKMETDTMSPQAGKRSNGDANVWYQAFGTIILKLVR